MASNTGPSPSKPSSIYFRLFLALPFLASFLAARQLFGGDALIATLKPIVATLRYSHKGTSYLLLPSFTGLKKLDQILRLLATAFIPPLEIDALAGWQGKTFLVDFGLLHTVLMIESCRTANRRTLAFAPVLVSTLAQLKGIGQVIGLWLFIVWPTSRIENLRAPGGRTTDMRFTSTILISMVLGFYIPGFAMSYAPKWEQRHYINHIWQIFPITVALLNRYFGFFMANTIEEDRRVNSRRDLGVIASALGTVVAISATMWANVMMNSPYTFKEMFWPTTLPALSTNLVVQMRAFLQLDQLFTMGNVLLWMLYSYADLKVAKLTRVSWFVLLPLIVTGVGLIGPGATFGVLWGYREYVLAYGGIDGAVEQKKQN